MATEARFPLCCNGRFRFPWFCFLLICLVSQSASFGEVSWTPWRVFPKNPISSDSVEIVMEGLWPNGCVPFGSGASVDGRTIYFDITDPAWPGIVCTQSLAKFTISQPVGPLSSGEHAIVVRFFDYLGAEKWSCYAKAFTVLAENPGEGTGWNVPVSVKIRPGSARPVAWQDTLRLQFDPDDQVHIETGFFDSTGSPLILDCAPEATGGKVRIQQKDWDTKTLVALAEAAYRESLVGGDGQPVETIEIQSVSLSFSERERRGPGAENRVVSLCFDGKIRALVMPTTAPESAGESAPCKLMVTLHGNRDHAFASEVACDWAVTCRQMMKLQGRRPTRSNRPVGIAFDEKAPGSAPASFHIIDQGNSGEWLRGEYTCLRQKIDLTMDMDALAVAVMDAVQEAYHEDVQSVQIVSAQATGRTGPVRQSEAKMNFTLSVHFLVELLPLTAEAADNTPVFLKGAYSLRGKGTLMESSAN